MTKNIKHFKTDVVMQCLFTSKGNIVSLMPIIYIRKVKKFTYC